MERQTYGNDPAQAARRPPGGAAAQRLVVWILWGAFVTTHLLFALVGFLVRDPSLAEPPQTVAPLAAIVAAVAVAGLGGAYVLAPYVLAPRTKFIELLIVRFAMVEVIGVLGLMLSVLGAPLLWSLAFAAAGVLAVLPLAPTEAMFDWHAQLRERASAS
jgi:hypothetical protein